MIDCDKLIEKKDWKKFVYRKKGVKREMTRGKAK